MPYPVTSKVSVGETRERIAKIANVGIQTVQGEKNILGRFPRHCNIRNIRIVYDQPTSIYTMTYIIVYKRN